MKCNVFYSWQSDLPNKTNRGFIQEALEIAAKSIRDDGSIQVDPVIDRDTAGISGAPDIADTIFDKIEKSQVMVFDISIINIDQSRKTPNPNVLLELGFALKAQGFSKIILVMNTAFGGPELLPFDLRQKRITKYNMPETNDTRANEKRNLARELEKGIRDIIKDLRVETVEEARTPQWDGEWISKHRSAAYEGLKKHGFTGFMEVNFVLVGRKVNFPYKDLLSAAGRAQIHNVFGWPIGIMGNAPEYRPKPSNDGIVCEVSVDRSYDYWALKVKGDFCLVKSIFEDEDTQLKGKAIYYDTRIVRIAETLLYCERLYTYLGVEPSTTVGINIKHGGLQSRQLYAANTTRAHAIYGHIHKCTENVTEHIEQVAISDIKPGLVGLVKKFAVPLFILFDYQEFDDIEYENIINKDLLAKME